MWYRAAVPQFMGRCFICEGFPSSLPCWDCRSSAADAGWLSQQCLLGTWDNLLLLKVAVRFSSFFLVSVIKQRIMDVLCRSQIALWGFSTFGRKESPFLSSWRLVAPWPTSLCDPINIHKPDKVIITDLVLARKEKLLFSGVWNSSRIFERADKRCGKGSVTSK